MREVFMAGGDPRWNHYQCEKCRFIGKYSNFDLWFCGAMNQMTVLHSNDTGEQSYNLIKKHGRWQFSNISHVTNPKYRVAIESGLRELNDNPDRDSAQSKLGDALDRLTVEGS